MAASVLRSDTAFAFYENPVSGETGSTVASTLLFSYKVTDQLAPLVRLGVLSNSPPEAPASVMPQPESGFALLNPVFGATYALKPSAELRLAFFLGFTLPIGGGGGDTPDPGRKAARLAGIPARSAMDNAMFAVNDFTLFPGLGLAYLAHGLTVQGEVTLLQLTRVRGELDQPDDSRTNFTTGLHVGYFLTKFLSAGVELRHQRWLSTPIQIERDVTDTLRDTTTVAFGPRLHFEVGDKMWLRPALALALPLDDPMQLSEHKILQVDVPFAF